MYDHVVHELLHVVYETLPLKPQALSIMGHSMGGHGSLLLHIKNPGLFRSCSAFSPISNPSKQCVWSHEVYPKYFGSEDKAEWERWDVVELLRNRDSAEEKLSLLVDEGMDDQFKDELQTTKLEEVCKEKGHNLIMNWREGYDHFYPFINSFVEDHIEYHAKHLT